MSHNPAPPNDIKYIEWRLRDFCGIDINGMSDLQKIQVFDAIRKSEQDSFDIKLADLSEDVDKLKIDMNEWEKQFDEIKKSSSGYIFRGKEDATAIGETVTDFLRKSFSEMGEKVIDLESNRRLTREKLEKLKRQIGRAGKDASKWLKEYDVLRHSIMTEESRIMLDFITRKNAIIAQQEALLISLNIITEAFGKEAQVGDVEPRGTKRQLAEEHCEEEEREERGEEEERGFQISQEPVELKKCNVCLAEFASLSELQDHQRLIHATFSATCPQCSDIFQSIEHLLPHLAAHQL